MWNRQRKRKKKANTQSSVLSPGRPWVLTKANIRIADERASSIEYSHNQEIVPGPHFTKPWTLRTMNAKLQFVTSGAFEWCIRDLLPQRQEGTLHRLCDVIKKMVSPQLAVHELPRLQAETHEALSLLERDFPLALQNLTTHLLHHIVDDLANYGPMYGRWLFPYERANGWITRQCLRKGMEESTVMETYVIYDWCVYMILSGRFNPGELFGSERTLVKASQKIMDQMDEGCSPTCTTQQQHATSPLTPEMESFMLNFYLSDLKLCTMLAGFSKTVTENHNILDITDQDGRRSLCWQQTQRSKAAVCN
uniref:Uncharacterized protein LOC111116474 n=1 Tax=Crassostrea virginica TaxID=6565 RepID=A0A8B8C7U0_CRAVI|nr:uncharacterized protein LOC111116474 [Crassostrea virginica]